MSGHGWVTPNPDGARARCGGPALCSACAREKAAADAASVTECRYCDQSHEPRWLCDPARRFLDAVAARGQRFDMPTMELDEPILGADAFGAGTVLLKQVVVLAATVPVAGTPRPLLIFTGTDAEGKPLPRWLFAGAASEIRRTVRLVSDMGELAIRTARKQAGTPS